MTSRPAGRAGAVGLTPGESGVDGVWAGNNTQRRQVMEIIASGLCFLLTCIVGWWAIRSRREAINIRQEIEHVRQLRRELAERTEKKA